MYCVFGDKYKMAGWSCCSGSLIIYILVVLFSARFIRYPMKLLGKDAKLQMLMAASDVSHPKIPESRLKMRCSSSQTETTIGVKAVMVRRLLSMTLGANLILLSDDISLNPGPLTNSPATMKGLVCLSQYMQPKKQAGRITIILR